MVGAWIYFVAFAGGAAARWTYLLVKLFTLVWPLVATPILLRRPLPRPHALDRRHRAALLPGLLLGAGLALVVVALAATSLSAVLEAASDEIRRKATQLGVLDHYLSFALLLSLAHSGLEEYYWRWFLFGNLRRHGSLGWAAGVASVAFAAHHGVVLGQYFPPLWTAALTLAVALGGVLWCLMYERQRTLTGAWLCHAIVDLAILWVGHRLLF